MENQRSTILVFLVAGIAGGVFVWQAAMAIVAFAALEDPILAGVLNTSSFLGLLTGAATSFGLMRVHKARTFVDSVWVELYRATWPTREETMSNTGVVVGATLFFSALLSVYDLVWGTVTDFFLYSA